MPEYLKGSSGWIYFRTAVKAAFSKARLTIDKKRYLQKIKAEQRRMEALADSLQGGEGAQDVADMLSEYLCNGPEAFEDRLKDSD